jgi:UDPglucose 6-dehydrogenase
MTEWSEFKEMDLTRIKALLQRPILIDLRNIFRPEAMVKHGFTYVSVGRPKIDPPSNA